MAQIKRNMMGDASLDFEEITRKGLEIDPENYETIIDTLGIHNNELVLMQGGISARRLKLS